MVASDGRPPRPDPIVGPPLPGRPGWRRDAVAGVIVALVVWFGSVGVAFVLTSPTDDATTGRASASAAPPSPADPDDEDPEPSFELRFTRVHRADLPEDWFRMIATDGSFSLTGPGRGYLRSMEDSPGWEIEMEAAAATCHAWIFDAASIPRGRAERTARTGLVGWAESYPEVLGAPRRVRLGPTSGWTVGVRWEGEAGAIVSVNRDGRQVYVLATHAPDPASKRLATVCLRSVRVPAMRSERVG